MAMDQTSKFCQRCNNNTLHARPGTNHLAHALVTLFLCGFWLPIWILASLKIGGWKCQTCGYGGGSKSALARLGLAVGCVVLFLGLVATIGSQVGHNQSTGQTAYRPQPVAVQPVVTPKAPVSNPPAQAQPDSDKQANPPKKPEKQTYKEGDDVHVGYTSYAVWDSWWSDRLSDNQFLNQHPNAKYLFVELTVRNDDTKARVVPPFTLLDDNGTEYEASSNAWAVQGSIGLIQSLNPSVSKQGFVVFDVPESRNYRLKLSGGYWSLEDAHVKLLPKASRDNARQSVQDRQDEQTRAEKKRQAEVKRHADRERQSALDAAKWRTWSSASGAFKTEAKYGGVISGKVKLTKRDGSTIQVPLEKLSDEDREWIKNRQK